MNQTDGLDTQGSAEPGTVTGAPPGAAAGRRSSVARGRLRRTAVEYGGPLGALVALVILFSIVVSGFLSEATFTSLLDTNSVFLILAIGVTFTMLCGGIDLSIAGVQPLAGIILAKLLEHHMALGPAIAIVLIGAVLFGVLVNGVLIGVLKVNFFIVTLGSLTALEGLGLQITNGSSMLVSGHSFLLDLGTKQVGIFPIDGLIGVALLVVAIGALHFTGFGRAVYAVGGNAEAARLAGVRTSLVTCLSYGVSACLAAAGGIIEVGRLGSAGPSTDTTIGLTAVAAALIGGVSFGGGKGTMFGSFLGVAFVSVLSTGLLISGISTYLTELITGVVLVAAVTADRFRQAGH